MLYAALAPKSSDSRELHAAPPNLHDAPPMRARELHNLNRTNISHTNMFVKMYMLEQTFIRQLWDYIYNLEKISINKLVIF